MSTSNRKKPASVADALKALSLEEIYALWAATDHWAVADAARLVLGLKPRVFEAVSTDYPREARAGIVFELARNCAGASLPCVVHGLPDNELRVDPLTFIDWAAGGGVEVPQSLRDAVEAHRQAHARAAGTSRAMRSEQRHRERCRALAAYLWQHEPELTKVQMARREELRVVGCERQAYTPETVERWIRDVNPNRAPGRRFGSKKRRAD